MSTIEMLLNSVVIYANLERVAELQQAESTALQEVIDLVGEVLTASDAQGLVDGVVDELTHPNVQGCIADIERTQACRAAGAAAFAAGHYAEAAEHYAASLRWAEESTPGGAELASRLYCNRALCFAKLGLHGRALADSTCAVARDARFAKAQYRRALAHQALGDLGAAAADAQRALWLQQDEGADTAAVQALLRSLPAEPETARQQPELAPEWTTHNVPLELHEAAADAAPACTVDAGCSVEHAAAFVRSVSPALDVRHSKGAGRELCAARAVSAGTDIFKERPFAHAVCKSHRQTHCAGCCKEIPEAGALYCERCPMVAYCSPGCRAADAFHRPGGPECGLPWPVLLPPDVVLALRVARKLLREGGSSEGSVVHSLATHFSSLSAEDAVHFAALAILAQAAWARAVQRGGVAGDDCQLSVVEVFKALCQTHVNVLAIVPVERSSAADRIGVGIFPAASLMNHACLPTVAVRFEGNTLVARSVAPLEPAAPLLHCYGPQPGEMVAGQRRAMLQGQYHFACGCAACADPPAAEAAMLGLRCRRAGCAGALPVPCDADAGIASKYELFASAAACDGCGGALSEAEWRGDLLPQLVQAHKLYEEGCQSLYQWHRSGVRADDGAGAAAAAVAVAALQRSLHQRERVLHPYNQALGSTQDTLAAAFEAAGDGAAAVQQLLASLEVAEHNFPEQSTNVAFQRLKVAAALRQCSKLDADRRKADGLTHSALQVLRLHFGDEAAAAVLL